MVYNSEFTFPAGSTGTQGALLLPVAPTFEQIFSGVPLYYAGSVIQVQEIHTIFTSVTDENVVDVDLNWFQPHQFIGTWQVFGDDTALISEPQSEGYINNTIQKLVFRSLYTVTANALRPTSIGDAFVVSQCNLELEGASVILPPNIVLAVQRPRQIDPLLRGTIYRAPVSLADTEYFPRCKSLGFHIKPGCEVNAIATRIAIINDIYNDDLVASPALCELGAPSCDDEFLAFALGVNGGFPPNTPQKQVYTSVQACQSSSGQPVCLPQTFTCTNGDTRAWWFASE
jgi:hypothetical protein